MSSCGSCYAVGVIETIEAMMAIKTGKLQNLSVGQMIECNDLDMKCNGGDPCRLLNWLYTSEINVQTQTDYQLSNNRRQNCDSSEHQVAGIKVNDYSCNE